MTIAGAIVLLASGCSNVVAPAPPSSGEDAGGALDAARPSDEADEDDANQDDADDTQPSPTQTSSAAPTAMSTPSVKPSTPQPNDGAGGSGSSTSGTDGEGTGGIDDGDDGSTETTVDDDTLGMDQDNSDIESTDDTTEPGSSASTADESDDPGQSRDAGAQSGSADDAGPAPSAGGEVPDGYVKGIIGVGYGGLRIVSRDGGLTWGSRAYDAPSGGDDENLLRAVAYGNGRWIATGWKLLISDDGVQWSDLGMLQDGIMDHNPIIEGLAYHDGYFYAAGDGEPSRVYRSSDGVEWSDYAEIGETVKHTGLTHRGGLFVSYGDSETSYQSENAVDWIEMDGLSSATYCENEYRNFSDCHESAWFDEGFYLFPEWGGEIRRSTNGEDFETVYRDDQDNTLYRARAVAEGYVIPE